MARDVYGKHPYRLTDAQLADCRTWIALKRQQAETAMAIINKNKASSESLLLAVLGVLTEIKNLPDAD